MLASLADAPLDDPNLVYEPKYDGIRAIAEVSAESVRLWSRLGNEKTRQFPEIAGALQTWARTLKQPVILDGEIVALDANGEPTGFQQLQGRIHLAEGPPMRPVPPARPARPARRAQPASPARPSVAFIAFDVLRAGRTDLRDRPLVERRAALERLFGKTRSPLLRISTIARGNGRKLYAQALKRGWEGLIAKHAASLYKSGKRTPDWRKLKIVHEQEFVIGGWTEPRQTRAYFGALLLGVYEPRTPNHEPRTKNREPRTKNQERRVGLCGPHRDRVQRTRARARDEPVEAPRNARVPVRDAPENQRTAALGASRTRRANQVHGMDRGRQAAASGVSRAARRQGSPRRPQGARAGPRVCLRRARTRA